MNSSSYRRLSRLILGVTSRCSEAVVILVVIALSGCGYTFQGGGSILPPDIKRVYVANVENNTTQLGLAQVVGEALQEQFDRYGVITVVEKQSEADALLKVKITDLKRTTRATQSNTDVALSQESTLLMTAELQRVTGQVLWRDTAVKVSRSFGTAAGAVVTSSADFDGGSISGADLSNLSAREISRGQEQEVLIRLAEDAALMIYNGAVAPDF
jgi:outer membrane lipopolysaccharide assembly protein LptE/RlpB